MRMVMVMVVMTNESGGVGDDCSYGGDSDK